MKNFFLVFILAFFITACTHNQMTNTSLSDKQKIEKITQFYQERLKDNFPQLQIHFIKKIFLDGLEAFVFELDMAGEKSKEVVFIKDNIFFTDAVMFNHLIPLRDEAEVLLSKDKFTTVLHHLKEDKDYVVSLGSGKNQIYVFSDPECPFCQKYLKSINEKYLKENTVHFIFISVHNHFIVTASLYHALKDKTTDKEKLELIHQYFFNQPNYKASEKDIQNSKKLFEKYYDLGVNYTPFIIEKAK